MEPFKVVASFTFGAENIEEAGSDIRRLSEVAATAGFTIRSAEVEPMLPDEPESDGGTTYAPTP